MALKKSIYITAIASLIGISTLLLSNVSTFSFGYQALAQTNSPLSTSKTNRSPSTSKTNSPLPAAQTNSSLSSAQTNRLG